MPPRKPPHCPPTSPKLTADWRPGPRTPGWDELWRRILSDVLGHQGAPDDLVANLETLNYGTGVDEVDTDGE